MTPANAPTDRSRFRDLQFTIVDRRLTRLESTQLTGREVDLAFDLVDDRDRYTRRPDRSTI